MKLQPLLAIVFAALWLIGCAGGGGPILADPTVSQSDVNQARRTLATHHLAPSLNPPNHELYPRLARVWQSTRPAILATCRRTFSSGCDASVNQMRIVLVPHESVNAYADASNFTIGVHTGFMRSAGDDDEVAAVLAHEAAHLLFGHAQKKASNAATGGLLGGIAMGALGAALHQPGMNTDYIGDMVEGGFNAGWSVGRLAYSPEMEIEADQFAMYVLKEANRRLTAGTDLIVRLHRGDVPAPVRRGDGWAGYLATHPADDYRLAAMQSTLNDIRGGGIGRPLAKGEYLPLGTDPRQTNCGDEFRRRWPDCKSFTGNHNALNWFWKCPNVPHVDFPDLWKLCGAWYTACHERPETGACYR